MTLHEALAYLQAQGETFKPSPRSQQRLGRPYWITSCHQCLSAEGVIEMAENTRWLRED